MKKLKEKFIVFFLGFFVFLVLLEISLSITGYIHLHIAKRDTLVNRSDNNYVILCVGDSWTFGVGAPYEKSYPRQLEELLNKEIKDVKFKVVNRGVGGYNTAMILNEFNNNINGIEPDLVILLAGGANRWNAWGYRRYSNRCSVVYKIQDFLHRIRLYKLAVFEIYNIKNRKNNKRYDVNVSLSPKYHEYLAMEEEYEERGELDKAIEWYKKAVEICPKEIGVYTGVGMAYLLKGDTENARHWLNKALELKPNYATYGHMLISLLNRNNKWQDGKGCTEAIVLFSKFIATDPVARDFLKMVKNTKKYAKEQSTWISLDTENIIQICKNNGIKIILVNYSRDDDPGNAIANSILEKIALEHSIPFVNNYKVFQELFSKGEIKHDYFVRDGHPNAKGYALMARNIYNVIIEQKMFDINKRIKPEYTQLP